MVFPTGPLRTMIAGAVGGIVFWIVIFPADVVKSRIQVSRLTGSLLSIMVQIFRQEGKCFTQITGN
jgi:solute carrier family 25 ornithine transporter 2/15